MPVPKPDHQSVERRSLRQIAMEKIKAAILDHTLQPGEELKDADLQDWLGMSRTPVREALTELTRVGLVETEAQRFTRVAKPDPTTALFDLQTVGALLGGLTRVTIPALTGSARSQMIKATDRVLEAIAAGRRERILPLGVEVAELLRANCPNPVLVDATSDMIDAKIYRISLAGLIQNADLDRLTHNYTELRNAIEAGDAIAAELAVEEVFQLDQQLTQP